MTFYNGTKFPAAEGVSALPTWEDLMWFSAVEQLSVVVKKNIDGGGRDTLAEHNNSDYNSTLTPPM
jgi:hypothetical protein